MQDAICTLLNLPASEILLYNGGTPLSDDQCIDALPTFVLDLSVPLLGGKVHGSLARAGKVKGQTPKVSFRIEFFLHFYLFMKCSPTSSV